MFPRKWPPLYMEMKASRVCVSRSLWGRGLEWIHYSKRPPFGLCQARNHRKLRPPKQAATSPSAVLGEDWHRVPGFSDSPGRIGKAIGPGLWQLCSFLLGSPTELPYHTVLTEQPWGWLGDLRQVGMKWEVQTSGCWARSCYSALPF